MATDASIKEALRREKRTLLRRVGLWLETPMIILGFVWLALLVFELTRGLNPALEALGTGIWIIFIFDFGFRLALAPQKGKYLKRNWLTAISLLVPALRVFRFAHLVRVLRLGRAARGVRLFRVLSSLNRGMSALGKTMGRRGFGYALALTIIVVFAGAAGMHAFENDNADGRGLHDYLSLVDSDDDHHHRVGILAANSRGENTLFAPRALCFRCVRLSSRDPFELLHRARCCRRSSGARRRPLSQRPPETPGGSASGYPNTPGALRAPGNIRPKLRRPTHV